jgi:hypothetical protein
MNAVRAFRAFVARLWCMCLAFVRSAGGGHRRRHPRRPTSRTVDWRLFGSQVRHISALADLSPGGAFVRAAYPRPVGSPVVLDMPSKGGVVHVHARVAWCGPDGMGVRFTRELA